jgi:hypothetical protein
LNATNTYTLGTTNLAGLLAGKGVISGPMVIYTNGIIGAGTAGAIGTFTVNNSITFIGGNVLIRVDKSLSPAQSNDLIVATGVITNSLIGPVTVTITNIGGSSIVVGDIYKVFSTGVSNGAAITVTGAGMGWVNNLAVDGSVTAVNSVIIPSVSAGITSFNLAGANTVINATNGVNGGTYYLLQSTNMASPLSQWLVVATNVINTNGASGAFTFTGTNVVTPNGAQQFYILSNTNNH